MARHLACESRVIRDQGDMLVLKVATTALPMQTDNTLKQLAQGLSETLQRQIRVTIEPLKADETLTQTPSELLKQQKAERLAAAVTALQQTPVIQALGAQFGAQLSETSIEFVGS